MIAIKTNRQIFPFFYTAEANLPELIKAYRNWVQCDQLEEGNEKKQSFIEVCLKIDGGAIENVLIGVC